MAAGGAGPPSMAVIGGTFGGKYNAAHYGAGLYQAATGAGAR